MDPRNQCRRSSILFQGLYFANPALHNTPFNPVLTSSEYFESVYGVWSDSRAGGELGSAAGQLVVGVEGRDLYFLCALLLSFALFTRRAVNPPNS